MPLCAFSTGDRVLHTDVPDSPGTITSVKHEIKNGMERVMYAVEWDDGDPVGDEYYMGSLKKV